MPRTDALKVAVIGGGNIAQKHLEVLRDLPEAELTALVDSNPKTLQETADRFHIPGRLPTHVDLLAGERPDAVFVLVSVLKVAEVASDLLRAGIPTFLEKPPGLYTAQTRELADLARANRVPAMVGVNRRFYSSLLKGREALLASGPIRSVTVEAHEDVQRVRENPKFPEEVLRRWSAANGVHALDLLRYFGGEVSEIQAAHAAVEGPMPDSCSALIRFESGASGRALMDWFAPGRHRVEARGVGITFSA
jgi:virulence factor